MTEITATAVRAADVVRELYPHLNVPLAVKADWWSAPIDENGASILTAYLREDGIAVIDWDDCRQPWNVWIRPDGKVTVQVALPSTGHTVNGEATVSPCAGIIETIGDALTPVEEIAEGVNLAVDAAWVQWNDAYRWASHLTYHHPHDGGYHVNPRLCGRCHLEYDE